MEKQNLTGFRPLRLPWGAHGAPLDTLAGARGNTPPHHPSRRKHHYPRSGGRRSLGAVGASAGPFWWPRSFLTTRTLRTVASARIRIRPRVSFWLRCFLGSSVAAKAIIQLGDSFDEAKVNTGIRGWSSGNVGCRSLKWTLNFDRPRRRLVDSSFRLLPSHVKFKHHFVFHSGHSCCVSDVATWLRPQAFTDALGQSRGLGLREVNCKPWWTEMREPLLYLPVYCCVIYLFQNIKKNHIQSWEKHERTVCYGKAAHCTVLESEFRNLIVLH